MKVDINSKADISSVVIPQSEKQSESTPSQSETDPSKGTPKEAPEDGSKEPPKDPPEKISEGSKKEIPTEYKHTLYANGPISYMEHSELTSKDIYRNYWHCRNSEISNQWQRFFFLAVFMILCFTFYGVMVRDLANTLRTDTDKVTDLYWNVANGISFLLCVAGVVLSCLWIMMAKASKTWCGIYESAIAASETYGFEGCWRNNRYCL